MLLQSNQANIRDVLNAFSRLHENWTENVSIQDNEKRKILECFTKRWENFASNHLGSRGFFLSTFLGLSDKTREYLTKKYRSEDPGCLNWVQAMLPPSRYEQFEAEHRIILDNEVLGLAILVSDFPVQ